MVDWNSIWILSQVIWTCDTNIFDHKYLWSQQCLCSLHYAYWLKWLLKAGMSQDLPETSIETWWCNSGQIQSLRKSWDLGLVSEKRTLETGVPDIWEQGKADAIVQREREKGKDREGKRRKTWIYPSTVLPRPSVIEFCLPLQWWWVLIFSVHLFKCFSLSGTLHMHPERMI